MIVGVILMRGNLSIIYGEHDDLYLDLIKGMFISEIDEYTSNLINSEDIRRMYEDKIQEFNLEHKDKLKELNDKRGRVVITYQDEVNSPRIYKLRVLYQKNSNKLDLDYVFKQILKLLKEEKNPKLSAELIKKNMFLFETDFAKHRIKDAEEKVKSAREKSYLNTILVEQVLKKTIDDLVVKDYEKAYFGVRKMDSFLERKKEYVTTPELEVTYHKNKNLFAWKLILKLTHSTEKGIIKKITKKK